MFPKFPARPHSRSCTNQIFSSSSHPWASQDIAQQCNQLRPPFPRPPNPPAPQTYFRIYRPGLLGLFNLSGQYSKRQVVWWLRAGAWRSEGPGLSPGLATWQRGHTAHCHDSREEAWKGLCGLSPTERSRLRTSHLLPNADRAGLPVQSAQCEQIRLFSLCTRPSGCHPHRGHIKSTSAGGWW